MGSDISCLAKDGHRKESANTGAASEDGIYEDGEHLDGVSVSSDRTPSSHPQPPSYPPPPNPKLRSPVNNHNHKDNPSDDPDGDQTMPAGAQEAEAVKNKNGSPKQSPIWHDVNGYAMPLPKSGKAASAANGGKSKSAAPNEKSRNVDQKKDGFKKGGEKNLAMAKKEDLNQREKGKSTNILDVERSDTGAYCNVIIPDNRGSKSFSNEIYQDTDVHTPEVSPTPKNVGKPANTQEKSQNSKLTYIEVEFVNQPEVTQKRPKVKQPKVKRPPSPIQYSDVISENGTVRLVTDGNGDDDDDNNDDNGDDDDADYEYDDDADYEYDDDDDDDDYDDGGGDYTNF
ncbi:hypothetical protein PoB_003451400 [Plakobranchus ocellatus]|uniref:Uncharacterized protein n=1 Tax=Plakobranchus ocellatus TaxID=259542 RepID=A0AAV4AP80_9GAST|nr:hypothetical protein PoB_003451400 [Plakobranchus ocellatus]